MNLHDQLGALESSLDVLLRTASLPAAVAPVTESSDEPPAPPPVPSVDGAELASVPEHAEGQPTLTVARPERDTIQMTIAGKSVLLNPEGVSELIEELSNVRASMSAEQPTGIAPGWRFAATKNPVMAVQKHANGDRLLIMRHTGHGWVPFTFSPDMVVELYTMLTKR